MKKFIYVSSSEGTMSSVLFKDLTKHSDKTETVKGFFSLPEKPQGFIVKYARKLCKIPVLYELIFFFFDILFFRFKKIDKENDYYILSTNLRTPGLSYVYLRKFFRKNPNVHLVFLTIDTYSKPFCRCMRHLCENIPEIIVYTYDKDDADKYGFNYNICIYSKVDLPKQPVKYDLYFSGYDKGRLEMLKSIQKKCEKNNILSYIKVVSKEEKSGQKDGIHFIDYNMPYMEILNETMQTNCILEILQEGQAGSTLRYYEALMYNKKLLTNNKNIVNLPFYDSEYMFVFEKPEDIDYDWIARTENINYNYDGRFSPLKIIDKIEVSN